MRLKREFTTWQLQLRRSLWVTIGVPAAMLFFVLCSHAQADVTLPPLGGDGGGRFTSRCPAGQHLAGFELSVGDDVDSIRPLCVVSYGPAKTGRLNPNPSKFGGYGAGTVQGVCPDGAPIVTGLYIGAAGKATTIVKTIRLTCGIAAADQSRQEVGLTVFDGPQFSGGFSITEANTQHCPTGLVAVGINGRSGIWLDAVGLICGQPLLTTLDANNSDRPIVVLERVKPSTGGVQSTSICMAARAARARNSPAAPGLEEKCRAAGAAGEKPPPLALGRVKLPPTGTLPSRSICESARDARARNSPAAPGLEEKCRADLAATGAAIAQVDEIVAEARAAEADALYQQGFDIATGIFGDPALGARGNTATGPGSLRIRDALSAVGQRGFNASVKLHLSRDYKQTPVQTGATITAGANPVMVPNGQAFGTTTISWKAGPDYTYCEIYLSVDNGEWTEFARGRDGTKPTTIKLGSSHTFRMMVYEGQAGTPKIISTLTVTAKN